MNFLKKTTGTQTQGDPNELFVPKTGHFFSNANDCLRKIVDSPFKRSVYPRYA